jgi:YXWGXW repeat-containing protein
MYEESLRLSHVSSDTRYGALLIALVLFVGPARVLADQTPPDVIHFCWTNCFSLSFGNGLYTRTDGSDETWTVERFTSATVILHRHSVPAAWNGFSADVIYQGEVSNDRLINVTLNGKPVPDIKVAWGAALDTLPGSNAERDQHNAAQTQERAIDASPPPPTELNPGVVDVEMRAADAPPPLLTEEQAPCTGDGYLWTPGYWAWGGGYYWVPGVWVLPPRTGLLWTPGYWGYSGAVFAFHPGYWGPHIGFYGGVNYGFGYPGVGFVGGRWVGNSFAYNRSVYHVDTAVIHNTYSESVVNNVALNRVSFNGGPGGITAAATAQERAAAAEPHIPPTAWQRQRAQQAAGNPALMARANDGHPVDVHPVAARPAAEVMHQAAGSGVPRAQSSVARPAHADAAPGSVERPARVHHAPITAANAANATNAANANAANPEGTAAQPAKPKTSSATTTKPQHLPKP